MEAGSNWFCYGTADPSSTTTGDHGGSNFGVPSGARISKYAWAPKRINEPSSFVFFVDTIRPVAKEPNTRKAYALYNFHPAWYSTASGGFALRHGGTGGAAYLDGHAATIVPQDWRLAGKKYNEWNDMTSEVYNEGGIKVN